MTIKVELNKEVVRYKVLVEFDIVQDYDGEENLKDSEEFAHDVCQLVCDEVANVGVCSYELLEHSKEVTEI